MNQNLPFSNQLPIEYLASCFDNVTNSYKFYWFLAILEHVKKSQLSTIPIQDLLNHMVASVWYPTTYFFLSFGKQDRLSQIATQVKIKELLKKHQIIQEISNQLLTDDQFAREVNSLARFVPYRFLRPFFNNQTKGKPDWQVNDLIAELAEKSFNNQDSPCLYRFVVTPQASIEIQAEWWAYLQKHLRILEDFGWWNLLNYLQRNNPNVPSIATKLFAPEQRDLNLAREFWRLVFNQLETINCIYSRQPMKKAKFSLDHFLPWRFVTHDLLWNLIPTPKNINSAKSDTLPDMQAYFNDFAEMQYEALQIVAGLNKTNLLEDYILLLKRDNISQIPFTEFKQILQDTMVPQFQIAKNMGFATNWKYDLSIPEKSQLPFND